MPINSHAKSSEARQGEAFLFGKDIMETNTFGYIWALLDPLTTIINNNCK